MKGVHTTLHRKPLSQVSWAAKQNVQKSSELNIDAAGDHSVFLLEQPRYSLTQEQDKMKREAAL